MQLIMFSKLFKDRSIGELAELAARHGLSGVDLCVRPGYPVDPENVGHRLVEAARAMERSGLSIPMVTGNFDLLRPDHPTAKPILAAMDKANIRLIKLGYFRLDPFHDDYWREVSQIRAVLEGWQSLGQTYGVKICYHTHSDRHMGLNCAALMHLIRGLDPRYIGAYVDPGHMRVEGEEFSVGLAMVRDYLSIVALKDVLLTRTTEGQPGKVCTRWVPAGEGMVDWTHVFSELKRVSFGGPLSIHAEFEVPERAFPNVFEREARFFAEQLRLAHTGAT